MTIVKPNYFIFTEKNLSTIAGNMDDLPPQIKNAENLFVFKQMMKTWGGVSCKCNLHENFSLNANTNKEIYR